MIAGETIQDGNVPFDKVVDLLNDREFAFGNGLGHGWDDRGLTMNKMDC